MKIFDENFEVVEMDALQVFKQSKRIIYSMLSGWVDFRDLWEDAEQECALLFFSKLVNAYDSAKGVIIWHYLKICYRKTIIRLLTQQKRWRYSDDINDEILRKKLRGIDLHNLKLETKIDMDKLLTAEQKRIAMLLLAGYDYTQICGILFPLRKCGDKKRPIYRRVMEIKYKLSRYFEIEYQAPACATRLVGGCA